MKGFEFYCPDCGLRQVADEDCAGQPVDCPACGRTFVAPAGKDASEVQETGQGPSTGSGPPDQDAELADPDGARDVLPPPLFLGDPFFPTVRLQGDADDAALPPSDRATGTPARAGAMAKAPQPSTADPGITAFKAAVVALVIPLFVPFAWYYVLRAAQQGGHDSTPVSGATFVILLIATVVLVGLLALPFVR